mgnify:CR=1 FL=1
MDIRVQLSAVQHFLNDADLLSVLFIGVVVIGINDSTGLT